MRRVSINILDHPRQGRDAGQYAGQNAGQHLLILPRPFEDWISGCTGIRVEGVSSVHEVQALNSHQRAWLAWVPEGSLPTLSYDFVQLRERDPADGFWDLPDNRYTRASAELAALAQATCEGCASESEAVRRLVTQASELFGYEHPEERFNAGHDAVPTLCGTTKGSCVDINTYLLAGARSLGIGVQYIAGYWFGPGRDTTADMHCWLAFHCDGEPLFWDLAHHLKWGVDGLAPGLNPAGGRRVPMSHGRGLRFATPRGVVEISHFSEPLWVLDNADTHKPALTIRLDEADHGDLNHDRVA
ncbi:MAG: transglutaminase-like domain-containing protein [Gammaproteobacteria bacterium]